MQMADERKIFLGSDFLFGKCFFMCGWLFRLVFRLKTNYVNNT